MTNELIRLTDVDRNSDRTFKDRESVLKQVEKHIVKVGHVRSSEIMEGLGIGRRAALDLITEVAALWREEDLIKIESQIRSWEDTVQDLEEHPENYTPEKISLLGLKAELQDRINKLRGLKSPDSSPAEMLNFHVDGQIKPVTAQRLVEYIQKREEKKPEPIEVKINDTTPEQPTSDSEQPNTG
jgi:hypothetical protein